VVVGLSGGIDSSAVAAIAVAALGRENVLGVSMPGPYSSEGSRADARQLAKNLGIEFLTIPITDVFHSYQTALADAFRGRPENVTEENLQARVRGNYLMALSNKFGSMVLSTGNKSEMAVGYCTLYGDMAGGLAMLSDVPKTMVYALANLINRERELIPRASFDKPPSAELRPNQTDQDSLPPYDVLDGVLKTNTRQQRWAASTLLRELGDLQDKKIAVLGLTYKPGTDTLRRSSVVELCRRVHAEGARIIAFDPAVHHLDEEAAFIDLVDTPELALAGADALVVGTEWPEFLTLSPSSLDSMRRRLVIDPKRWLEDRLHEDGTISYFGVGLSAAAATSR